jgi:HD-GYP domain-containing protein (c-di-GMP phosphodiesterase class II)
MNLIPLDQVQEQLKPGAPLPWNVRDGQGTLLLAKGIVVADNNTFTHLLHRGAFVDAAEVRRNTEEAVVPALQPFTTRWVTVQDRLGGVLQMAEQSSFITKLTELIKPVRLLTDENADELIFLILRHDHSRYSNYGIAHSMHTAALCGLLAKRMGWSDQQRHSLVGASLTMNLSILQLQGVLAGRGSPPTPAERQKIQEHPSASAQILRNCGLTDEAWLNAIEHHHEVPGGKGYPHGIEDPDEMSQLVRFCDSFIAKHSPRRGRAPLPAHQAARDLFVQGSGNPVASLLIKELGIYPPGCFVKLASGEIAIVTNRGETAKTPVVAALTNRQGDALSQPIRRDTSSADHAIVTTVSDDAVRFKVSAEVLYERRAQNR